MRRYPVRVTRDGELAFRARTLYPSQGAVDPPRKIHEASDVLKLENNSPASTLIVIHYRSTIPTISFIPIATISCYAARHTVLFPSPLYRVMLHTIPCCSHHHQQYRVMLHAIPCYSYHHHQQHRVMLHAN